MSVHHVQSEAEEDVRSNDLSTMMEYALDPTYWKRVRYSEEFIQIKQKPWKLQYIDGKGFTAFATKSIKAGAWILTEFPVVWINGHHPFTPEQVEEINSKVARLSHEDAEAFYAMANVFSEEEYPKAVGIFMTNCFDMTDSIYGVTCAMYLALARLNHSCAPNAQQTHLPDTTEEVLYASRDIAEGEEINDCYIDLRQNRRQRQASLLEYYRFTCACIACSLQDEKALLADDLIRTQALDYGEKIINMIEQEDQLEAALEYGLSMIRNLEQAETLLWSIRYLPEGYHIIYQIYFALGELTDLSKRKKEYKKNAIKYLRKCVKLNHLLQGERSPDALRTLKELQDYSLHIER